MFMMYVPSRGLVGAAGFEPAAKPFTQRDERRFNSYK